MKFVVATSSKFEGKQPTASRTCHVPQKSSSLSAPAVLRLSGECFWRLRQRPPAMDRRLRAPARGFPALQMRFCAPQSSDSASQSSDSASQSSDCAIQTRFCATQSRFCATQTRFCATQSDNCAPQSSDSAPQSSDSATQSSDSATQSDNCATQSRFCATQNLVRGHKMPVLGPWPPGPKAEGSFAVPVFGRVHRPLPNQTMTRTHPSA